MPAPDERQDLDHTRQPAMINTLTADLGQTEVGQPQQHRIIGPEELPSIAAWERR